MPTGISEKCRRIAPSATLAMDARAKALIAEGVSVIGFAAGEPDFDTPEPIREAMKQAMDMGLTRYAPIPGTPELRDAVCMRFEKDNGLHYTREQIVVSNGAKHSLYNVFQAILNPGDEVIIPSPCWVSYPEMVRMAGGEPVFVECAETDGFLPSIEALSSAVTPRTKAFILTTPSNPNGCVYPEALLRQIAALAVERDFYVVSDEIYGKLIYDGLEHISIASLGEDIKARTILVNGVSKSYAMTGFRIGYTAAPTDVAKAMNAYQSQSTSAPNTAALYAATTALTMPQACVEKMRIAFEERRNALVKAVNVIPGLSCRKPQGAFYVMVNINPVLGKSIEGKPILNSLDFAEALLDKAHVAVVPGSAFMAEGYVRISYSTSTANIAEGMRRIAEFVQAMV